MVLVISPLLNAQIATINEHSPLVAVQQFAIGNEVVDIGGDAIDTLDQPQFSCRHQFKTSH